MARVYHGILSARYNTSEVDTNTGGTELASIDADNSTITFEDEEGNPVDPYGNMYAGITYARATVRFQGLSAFATLKTARDAGTKEFWGFLLDGSTWANTTTAHLIDRLKPIDIQGRVQGRSDFFEMSFRAPLSHWEDLTT